MCIWLPFLAAVVFLKTQFGMAAQATILLLVLSWLILFFGWYSILPLAMGCDLCDLGLANHSIHFSDLNSRFRCGHADPNHSSEFFLGIFRKKKLG